MVGIGFTCIHVILSLGWGVLLGLSVLGCVGALGGFGDDAEGL